MKKLKALYIEDQPDNVETFGDLFRNNGFEIYSINPLPKNIDEYYKYILSEEIDFIIIDNELKRQVTYTGLDVLKEIRKQDSNIFIVLLTSFDYDEYVIALGELDYAIKKQDFNIAAANNLSKKIKRAYLLGEEIKINKEIDKEIERLNEKLKEN